MSTMTSSDLAGDFLEHYGILGMKWGERRYQNPDGTLTELGKMRRRKEAAAASKKKAREEKKKQKAEKRAAQKAAAAERRRREILDNPKKLYKHRKEFTKAEIDQAMAQFEWENKLLKQSTDRVEQGEKAAKQILSIAGQAVGGWNLAAQVINSFTDSDLPYIEKKRKEAKQDKDKKGS